MISASDHRSRNHIVVIGQMGAGKTTVGHLVAERVGWPFCDNDVELEQRMRVTAAVMQATAGADALHAAELQIVTELLHESAPSVIAAPASIVLSEHRDELRALAFVAWLRVTPAVLSERAVHSRHRPIPAGDALERRRAFEQLIAERDSWYARVADLCVDDDDLTAEEAADRIVDATRELRSP